MENDNERSNTFFRFEDLRIYHKAIKYAKWVNESTKKHVNNHQNVLVEKFNHAANSIALNIAEGSARNKSQFIYYLKMAKSAVRESLVYTSIMHQLEYFDDREEEESRNQLMEMTKMTGALISSLQRSSRMEEQDDSYPGDEMPAD
jgi:four helix bundle protein